MIDIAAIKARHLDPTKNRGRTYYAGHIEVDLAACVEEIQHLRSTNELLEQEARIRKNLCDGFAAEAEAERAAVVAMLRESQRMYQMHRSPGVESLVRNLADIIERGEHRREEER
jgi:hypothetical protein